MSARSPMPTTAPTQPHPPHHRAPPSNAAHATAALACTLLAAALLPLAPAAAAPREIETPGGTVRYRALTDRIAIAGEDGELRGEIFHTAYFRVFADGERRAAQRPVAFVFNGGPGSSSAWLHLGAFGPQRLVLGAAGLAPAPLPFRTATNPHSLLDVADLVFVDPIGTGYSRAVNPAAARGFYSFRGDVRSVGQFIKRFLDDHGRTRAPCILIGESYGAMRACGLAPELERRHGVVVNSLVLISGPIDMGGRYSPQFLLPTAAATAHFHGLLSEDLQQLERTALLAEVERFIADRYGPALAADPGELDRAQHLAVRDQLRELTGLEDLRRGLGFDLRDVRSAVAGALGVRRVGIYDARVTSHRRGRMLRGGGGDPALDLIREPMEALVADYLAGLGADPRGLDYRVLHRLPGWSHRGSRAATTLTDALRTNRGLRVFVASGLYDTVTPLGVVRETVARATMTDEQRATVFTFKHYEGGHMMYTNTPALASLSRDLRAFIRTTSQRKRGPALVPVIAPDTARGTRLPTPPSHPHTP